MDKINSGDSTIDISIDTMNAVNDTTTNGWQTTIYCTEAMSVYAETMSGGGKATGIGGKLKGFGLGKTKGG